MFGLWNTPENRLPHPVRRSRAMSPVTSANQPIANPRENVQKENTRIGPKIPSSESIVSSSRQSTTKTMSIPSANEIAAWNDSRSYSAHVDEARASVCDALRISRTMHDRAGVVWELKLLAEISAAAGDLLRAGIYLGAVEAEHDRSAVGSWLFGSLVGGQGLRPLASRLDVDEPELGRGREEGRRLELDDAVATALGDA